MFVSPFHDLTLNRNDLFNHKKTNLISREITYVYFRVLFVFVRFVRFLLFWLADIAIMTGRAGTLWS